MPYPIVLFLFVVEHLVASTRNPRMGNFVCSPVLLVLAGFNISGNVQPKEGLEDEALDDLQDMMDWQTSTAKKMGVTLKEFTDTAVGAQEHAMHDMVDELAGKMGVEPGALMSSAMIFSDRTQRAAEQCGLGHDEFLGAMYEVRFGGNYYFFLQISHVLGGFRKDPQTTKTTGKRKYHHLQAVEDAEEEDATEAAKLGMDVATYTDWASMIHANSDVKARKLGMTVDEYKAYAWNVVVEARKRDWSDDTEIPDAGSSDEEFDEPPGVPHVLASVSCST